MYELLIVDDEPLTREYIISNIKSIHEDWEAAGEAQDGEEALEFLAGRRVDLVITDIRMPGMDGLELCRVISLKYPGQKVIILSGHDEFAYAKEAILYGVNDYLLKPIVVRDLRASLDSIAKKLQLEKSREDAYNSLLNLSADSRPHVVKRFLQALINDANVEIKTLYPLIYRMKLSLLDCQGLILLLALDEAMLLETDLPVSDMPVYKFILNQAAMEIVELRGKGHVFLDPDENSCILFSGEDAAELRQACLEAAAGISSFMHENAHIGILAGLGQPIGDVLQLSQSYRSANRIIATCLFTCEHYVYSCDDPDMKPYQKRLEEVSKAISMLKSGFMDRNEVSYCLALTRLLEQIDCTKTEAISRLGIYIIKNLSSIEPGSTPEMAEAAMNVLKGFCVSPGALSKERALELYKDIIRAFIDRAMNDGSTVNDGSHLSEDGIMEKCKSYIYSHYAEPLSLPLIAEKLGISAGYLSQAFHKASGESYIQFLTRVRMEQAAKLLKACPEERLSRICEKVGYMGVKHFSYAFKMYFSMTPGEYRLKHQ